MATSSGDETASTSGTIEARLSRLELVSKFSGDLLNERLTGITRQSISEIESKVGLLEAAVECRSNLIDERLKTAVTTARAAAEAANERLHTMGELLDATRDITLKLMTRDEALAALLSTDQKLTTQIGGLRDKLETYSRPNYLAYSGLFGGLAAIIASVWVVIGLKIDNSISPALLQIESLKRGNEVQDQNIQAISKMMRETQLTIETNSNRLAQSELDRKQINERLKESEVTSNRLSEERRAAIANQALAITRLQDEVEAHKERDAVLQKSLVIQPRQ